MRMAALILLARAQHEQAAGIHLPGAGGAFQPPRARCGERERIGRGPLGRDRAIIRRVLENIHRDGAGAGQRAVRSPANPMRPCPDLPYTDWKSWSLAGRATSPASARLPIRTAGAASQKTPDCGQRSNSSAYGRAARGGRDPLSHLGPERPIRSQQEGSAEDCRPIRRLGTRSPRTSRSLIVMRSVSWWVSGQSRTVPASPER